MSGLLATLRLDLRMLRREYLGAAALLALSLLGAASAEAHAVGGGARGLLFGALLAAVGGAAAVRLQRVDAAWNAFRPTLPVWQAGAVLLQLLARFGFAALLGVAFARWTSPHGPLDVPRALTAALWLMLLLQVVAWGIEDHESPAQGRFPRTVMSAVSLLMLLGAFLDLADLEGSWLTLHGRTWRWLLFWVLACWVQRIASAREALPHSGPKAVLPRPKVRQGDLQRGLTPRTPAQVLRHLGLGGPGRWLRLPAWFVAGAFLASHDGYDRNHLWWAPLPVLGTGVLGRGLWREVGRPSASGRPLPGAVAPLWRRAFVPVLLALLVGLAARMTMGHGFHRTPPTSDLQEMRTRVTERLGRGPEVRVEFYPFERAVLHVPDWAAAWTFPAEHRVGDPIARGPVWWLRDEEDWRVDWRRVEPGYLTREAWADWEARMEPEPPATIWADRVPLAREREHFARAVQTYLARVHGVRVEEDECAGLLDVSDTIRRKRTVIRRQVFGELWSARGDRIFEREDRVLGPLFRRVDVVDALLEGRVRDDGEVVPPIELFSYATGVGRIERVFGARIRRAARLTYLLDIGLQLIALLLFVRLAMTRGTVLALAPLLPVIALYAWFGTRGQDWHLLARDLHLAWPWASLALALLIGGGLLRGIARRLDAVEP